jgi:hypothetical protein
VLCLDVAGDLLLERERQAGSQLGRRGVWKGEGEGEDIRRWEDGEHPFAGRAHRSIGEWDPSERSRSASRVVVDRLDRIVDGQGSQAQKEDIGHSEN